MGSIVPCPPPPLLTLPFSEKDQMVPINLFVYSPSDTERAVTAKLKRNNAICSVDVFTLIMSLVHLARRQRIDRQKNLSHFSHLIVFFNFVILY